MNISESHIAELKKQNAELIEKNERLRKIVVTVPKLLTAARIDALRGVPTIYDYIAHNTAIAR